MWRSFHTSTSDPRSPVCLILLRRVLQRKREDVLITNKQTENPEFQGKYSWMNLT